MSRQEAIDELIRCSGTQFDPKIVKAAIGALGGQEKPPATTE
jgi:HD-GYP domain-containing protein (c-di-GMP phosphodiesterase class II)